MTVSPIQSLIDKQDAFEIVRDKVAQILANESANQQALAIAAGKDPALWDLKVYTERSIPWDGYTEGDQIVNVWFDGDNPEDPASNVVNSQVMVGQINVDVYAFGTSKPDGTGQISGDEAAARGAARTLRLVRNILMADSYTYLDLRGVVGRRWPSRRSIFQPQLNNTAAEHIMGGRMELSVHYEELSPQYEPVPLAYISLDITRAPDGMVLAQVDFDFT